MTEKKVIRRLAMARRQEDAWSMWRFDAEESFGIDSPQERRALERATDWAIEADMLDEVLEAGAEI